MTITSAEISGWVGSYLWPFFRIGALVGVAPIFGAHTVPVRVRIGLALALTLLVVPLLPPAPAIDALTGLGALVAFHQVAIGAAMGIGAGIKTSGLAGLVAHQLIGLAGGSPWMVLAMVYLVTLIFTELLTNNAAAALVYPIAIEASRGLAIATADGTRTASHLPFAIAIMVAASSGFATPFGYQTHLMVYGPGGYRFSDFLRIGIPLDLLFMAVTVWLTPLFFPF